MDERFKKLTEADLPNYLGKEVNTHQLEDILDVFIILTNVQIVKDYVHNSYIKGILDEFSKERIWLSKRNSTLVYHPSYLRGEWVNIEY